MRERQPPILIYSHEPDVVRQDQALAAHVPNSMGWHMWQCMVSVNPAISAQDYERTFERRVIVIGDYNPDSVRAVVPSLWIEFRGRSVLVIGPRTWQDFAIDKGKIRYGGYHSDGRVRWWAVKNPLPRNNKADNVTRKHIGEFLVGWWREANGSHDATGHQTTG